MRSSRKYRKLIVFSLSLFLAFQSADSNALITANRNINQNSGTGFWASNLASATGVGSNTSYQITWTGNSNKQYELISIVNIGNFDLVAEHLTFSTAKGNGDTTNPPTLTFETCSGTWDVTTFACSGTITQIASGTVGLVNVNRYLFSGNRVILRVTNARNNTGNHITTFVSQCFRSDIRFGIVINS